MSKSTTGIYFDGKSSLPQQVRITFNENSNSLYIENGFYHRFIWKISDIEVAKNQDELTLNFIENPGENIIIRDKDFISHFRQFKKIGWHQNLLERGRFFYVGLIAFFVAFLACSYFFIIPWIGEKSIQLIPESYDQKIGETTYNNFISQADIDQPKTKLLNDFAKQIKFSNLKPLKFTVVKSQEINAFALPNGDIVIFTGILDKMKTYEELVALIGHEATHVHHRHSMKMLAKNLSGYIFISTVLGDANGVITVIGENAHALNTLSYSRQYEEDADQGGFTILKNNHINPKGMVDLFKTLDNENKNSAISEFISTHPITQNRIINTQRLIKETPYSHQENTELKKLFLEIKK